MGSLAVVHGRIIYACTAWHAAVTVTVIPSVQGMMPVQSLQLPAICQTLSQIMMHALLRSDLNDMRSDDTLPHNLPWFHL